MARMTDSEYAQATKMGRALYQFLNDHGEDGDGFSDLFSSLDSLFGSKDCKQASVCETRDASDQRAMIRNLGDVKWLASEDRSAMNTAGGARHENVR
jgi:hypothetical protein